MKKEEKYNQILDSLELLLKEKSIENISVSEIAKTAGIAKGSVYYYFESKDAVLYALIERGYKDPVQIACELANQSDISPIERLSRIFKACRKSSKEFLAVQSPNDISGAQQSLLHQKYINYMVSKLRPELAEILRQAKESRSIKFDNVDALADIILLVLTVKFDNSLCPSKLQEIQNTISGLIDILRMVGNNDEWTNGLERLQKDMLTVRKQ